MSNCISAVFKNNFIINAATKPRVKTGIIVLAKVIGTFGCSYKYSEKTREQWAFAFKNKKTKHVKTPKKHAKKKHNKIKEKHTLSTPAADASWTKTQPKSVQKPVNSTGSQSGVTIGGTQNQIHTGIDGKIQAGTKSQKLFEIEEFLKSWDSEVDGGDAELTDYSFSDSEKGSSRRTSIDVHSNEASPVKRKLNDSTEIEGHEQIEDVNTSAPAKKDLADSVAIEFLSDGETNERRNSAEARFHTDDATASAKQPLADSVAIEFFSDGKTSERRDSAEERFHSDEKHESATSAKQPLADSVAIEFFSDGETSGEEDEEEVAPPKRDSVGTKFPIDDDENVPAKQPLADSVEVMFHSDEITDDGVEIEPDLMESFEELETKPDEHYRELAKEFFKTHRYNSELYFEEALAKASNLALELFENRQFLPCHKEMERNAARALRNGDAESLYREELFKRTLASYMEERILHLDRGYRSDFQKVEPGNATKELFGDNLYRTQLQEKVTYVAKMAIIGRGAFNEVRFAADIFNGGVRAIRELTNKSKEAQAKLPEEAIAHRRIASVETLRDKVITLWASFDTVWVLNFANKGSLHSLIKNKALNNDQKKDIALQVVSFMRDFHEEGWVYGDLKTDNILIHSPEPGIFEVNFCDFGGVYHKPEQKPKDASTPICMAPEMFETFQTDEFTDRWIIGLMLYEMKYRQDPRDYAEDDVPDFVNKALDVFSIRSPKSTGKAAKKLMKEALKTPEKYFDKKDPYDQIIMDLLSYKPEDRPELDEVLDRLEDASPESFSIKLEKK